jgi:hypothetical protein
MKHLLVISILAIFSFLNSFGQSAIGLQLPGCIVPTDSTDNYYVFNEKFGLTTWKIVNTTTEMLAIPTERRQEGMHVWVRDKNRSYSLKDCIGDDCFILDRIDTLYQGTLATGTVTVKPDSIDPSFFYDGYTHDGYQRFGVSKNGTLLSGRRMPLYVNVDALFGLGDRFELTGTSSGVIGKDSKAIGDTSMAIGYNVEANKYNTIIIGQGTDTSESSRPVSRKIGSVSIVSNQKIPQIELTKNAIRLNADTLLWNDSPISSGGSTYNADNLLSINNDTISIDTSIFRYKSIFKFGKTSADSLYYRCSSKSYDGKYQLYSTTTGLYLSTDYGVTNSLVLGSGINYNINAMSYDGKYMIVTDKTNNKVEISSDYGSTWTTKTIISGFPQSVGISKYGQYISVAFQNNYIYYSSDYGSTWNQSNSPQYNWDGYSNIIISNDGKTQIASVYSGGVYYSSDYGLTWTLSNLTSGTSGSLTSTKDLSLLLIDAGTSIYYSKDKGITWTKSTSDSKTWFSSLPLRDGKYCYAASYNGDIYLSEDYAKSFNFVKSTNISFGIFSADYNANFVTLSGNSKIYLKYPDVIKSNNPIQFPNWNKTEIDSSDYITYGKASRLIASNSTNYSGGVIKDGDTVKLGSGTIYTPLTWNISNGNLYSELNFDSNNGQFSSYMSDSVLDGNNKLHYKESAIGNFPDYNYNIGNSGPTIYNQFSNTNYTLTGFLGVRRSADYIAGTNDTAKLYPYLEYVKDGKDNDTLTTVILDSKGLHYFTDASNSASFVPNYSDIPDNGFLTKSMVDSFSLDTAKLLMRNTWNNDILGKISFSIDRSDFYPLEFKMTNNNRGILFDNGYDYGGGNLYPSIVMKNGYNGNSFLDYEGDGNIINFHTNSSNVNYSLLRFYLPGTCSDTLFFINREQESSFAKNMKFQIAGEDVFTMESNGLTKNRGLSLTSVSSNLGTDNTIWNNNGTLYFGTTLIQSQMFAGSGLTMNGSNNELSLGGTFESFQLKSSDSKHVWDITNASDTKIITGTLTSTIFNNPSSGEDQFYINLTGTGFKEARFGINNNSSSILFPYLKYVNTNGTSYSVSLSENGLAYNTTISNYPDYSVIDTNSFVTNGYLNYRLNNSSSSSTDTSLLVHKAGVETITGVKKFSATPVLESEELKFGVDGAGLSSSYGNLFLSDVDLNSGNPYPVKYLLTRNDTINLKVSSFKQLTDTAKALRTKINSAYLDTAIIPFLATPNIFTQKNTFNSAIFPVGGIKKWTAITDTFLSISNIASSKFGIFIKTNSGTISYLTTNNSFSYQNYINTNNGTQNYINTNNSTQNYIVTNSNTQNFISTNSNIQNYTGTNTGTQNYILTNTGTGITLKTGTGKAFREWNTGTDTSFVSHRTGGLFSAYYTNNVLVHQIDKSGYTTTQALILPRRTDSNTTEGQIHNDTTYHNIKGYINGVSQALSGTIFTQIADGTVANTTTETTLFSTGIGTTTLPANFLTPGKTYKIVLKGYISGANNAASTLNIKLGSTTLVTSTENLPSAVTNVAVDIEFTVTCRTSGSTGTVIGQGRSFLSTSTSINQPYIRTLIMTSPATIDCTASNAINVTYTWGSASTTNSITITNAIITIEN